MRFRRLGIRYAYRSLSPYDFPVLNVLHASIAR